MEETQRALATLMVDREEGQQYGASGGSIGGIDAVGIRGTALVMKHRREFFKEPEASWDRLEDRIKDHLYWEGGPWSVEEYGRPLPWGSFRTLKQWLFTMAKVHRALKEENVPLAKGLVAQ